MLPGLILPNQMARGKFVTDLREYAVGARPADWTLVGSGTSQNVVADLAAAGGRSVQVVPTAAHAYIYWTLAGAAITDGEILALLRTGSSPTAANGVVFRVNTGSVGGYGIYSTLGGTNPHFIKIGVADFSGVGFNLAATTRYWYRVRFQGTSLQARVWQFGTAEPSSWHVSITDASYASGAIGIASGNSNEADYIEFFSFVPGNRTAPGLSG